MRDAEAGAEEEALGRLARDEEARAGVEAEGVDRGVTDSDAPIARSEPSDHFHRRIFNDVKPTSRRRRPRGRGSEVGGGGVGVEDEAPLLDGGVERDLGGELAAQDGFGQGGLHDPLDGAADGTGAELGIAAAGLEDRLGDGGAERQVDGALPPQALGQAGELFPGDVEELLG